MSEPDEQAGYQERLDRIGELFAGIVSHAEASSLVRCPYRDRHDLCTAQFRCRNQIPVAGDEASLACGHDGKFDYRTAWESHPRSHERAKAKVEDIKQEAAARRNTKPDTAS